MMTSDDGLQGSMAQANTWLNFYNHLYELWRLKDQAYLNNDLESWYKSLNRMFVHISFKLSESEKQDFTQLFDEVREEVRLNKRSEATDKLHSIDRKLIRSLDHYKMIFPKVTEDFKLEG